MRILKGSPGRLGGYYRCCNLIWSACALVFGVWTGCVLRRVCWLMNAGQFHKRYGASRGRGHLNFVVVEKWAAVHAEMLLCCVFNCSIELLYVSLSNKWDPLSNRWDVLSKKCYVLSKKSNVLSNKCDVVSKKCDVLSKKCDVLSKTYYVLSKKCDVLSNKCDVLSKTNVRLRAIQHQYYKNKDSFLNISW